MINALKNLPPWAQTAIAWVLLIGGLVFTNWAAWAPPLPRWAQVAAGVFMGIGGALRVGVINVNLRALLPLGLGLAVLSSACSPTTWEGVSIRTADTVRAAVKTTIPPLMAKHAKDAEKKCDTTHTAGSKEHKACGQKIIKQLRAWHFARAAGNALIFALKNLYDVAKPPKASSRPVPRPTTPAPRKPAPSPKPTPVTPLPRAVEVNP